MAPAPLVGDDSALVTGRSTGRRLGGALPSALSLPERISNSSVSTPPQPWASPTMAIFNPMSLKRWFILMSDDPSRPEVIEHHHRTPGASSFTSSASWP
jgi:hypothetical protein